MNVRPIYVRFIRPHIRTELGWQRVKLLWFMWEYVGLLSIRSLPLSVRIRMVLRFLHIDWNVAHSHRPSEIETVVRALAARPVRPGDGMVEAGCYMGGSTTKFSIACKLLGYQLWVYDSFEGVEPMTDEEKRQSYDFSGQYAAEQELVERNLVKFGERGVCTLYKGWFRATLALGRVPGRVGLAYIDCDLAKGTEEALIGVMPALAEDGMVFSQDYHIPVVQQLLADPTVWRRLRAPSPRIERVGTNLAILTFPSHNREAPGELRTPPEGHQVSW